MKIGTNKFIFLIVFFFAFANSTIAQPPPPPPENPPPAPIDEYIYIAIIVSLIFGTMLIYDSVKKNLK